jgi:CRP-like cAMP-binding protein
MSGGVGLGGVPPFDLLGAEARGIAERLAVRTSLRKGKALYYQGDRATFLNLVVSGSLRAIMYRSDESTLELGRMGRGHWLPLAEVLLASPCLTDTVAEETCDLICFPRESVPRLLEAPGMLRILTLELARRHYALHSRIELNVPQERILRFLEERFALSRDGIDCTQEEIAKSVGVTRETVNRHLGQLQEEGRIVLGRGVIKPGPKA